MRIEKDATPLQPTWTDRPELGIDNNNKSYNDVRQPQLASGTEYL